MIKAILMDFNGVIIDDEPIQMRAYQEVLKSDGIDLTEDDYYSSLGMDDRTFVRAAFGRVDRIPSEDDIDRVCAAKSEKWGDMIASELPLFDGIEGFVQKMSHEFSLGVVSMAARKDIEHVLQKSGMRGNFSTIVSAEDITNCKPDPECFQTGFQRLDEARTAVGHLPMTHYECLVIEDSPPGIAAARRADLLALGVANTVSEDQLRGAGAAAIALDLRDWMPESIKLVFS